MTNSERLQHVSPDQRRLMTAYASELTGDYAAAMDTLRDATASPDVDVRAHAFLKLGQLHSNTGDFAAALIALRSAVECDAVASLEARIEEAVVLARTGETDASERAFVLLFEELLKTPDDPPILLMRVTNELLLLLSRRGVTGDAEALRLINAASDRDPRLAEWLHTHHGRLSARTSSEGSHKQ